jgi:hypothetical protein
VLDSIVIVLKSSSGVVWRVNVDAFDPPHELLLRLGKEEARLQAASRQPGPQRLYFDSRLRYVNRLYNLAAFVAVYVLLINGNKFTAYCSAPKRIRNRRLCRFIANWSLFGVPALNVGGITRRIATGYQQRCLNYA